MGSEERIKALLAGAGFRSVRMEDVTVHFSFRDLDDYERWIIDVGARSRWRCGALRGMSGKCSGHDFGRHSSHSPPTVGTTYRASLSVRLRAEG